MTIMSSGREAGWKLILGAYIKRMKEREKKIIGTYWETFLKMYNKIISLDFWEASL